MEARKGLHARWVGTDRTGRTCAHCHNEHNGRGFDLIRWAVPVAQFDHNSTGYRLEARHAQLTCRACHQAKYLQPAVRATLLVKDPARTYLGLSQRCADCHQDVHRGELSNDCGQCHNPQDWKKPVRFDHRKARFIPDGVHEKISCIKCHVPEPGNTVAKYRNLSFQDCSPCHRDPHAGAFRNACKSCHSSKTAWKQLNLQAGFNHSQTRYPLEGKHAGVRCTGCHPHADFNRPIPFAECRDCHKSDPHRGQFTSAQPKRECRDCHTVAGFKPAVFGVEQHKETSFPLRQAHVSASCVQCHKPGTEGVVAYRSLDISCISCHRDVHLAQFAGEPYRNDCAGCHNQQTFKPSAYTFAQHSGTRFPLSGGHMKPDCDACHKPGVQPVKFRFEDRTCTVCHQDPHQNQFAVRINTRLSDGTLQGCQACHSVDSWQDLSSFDHTSTGFALEGAHSKAECSKCHKSSGSDKAAAVAYRNASRLCDGCHRDPHAGQFATRMKVLSKEGSPAGCAGCHGVESWRQLTGFDHDSTSFPLRGGHQPLPCSKCHAKPVSGPETAAVIYVNRPGRCSDCHEDVHDGQFRSERNSADCALCHREDQWQSSSFDHDRQSTYPLSGAHRNVPCAKCHSSGRVKDGKKIVVYRGTARECSACHGSDSVENQP